MEDHNKYRGTCVLLTWHKYLDHPDSLWQAIGLKTRVGGWVSLVDSFVVQSVEEPSVVWVFPLPSSLVVGLAIDKRLGTA